MGIHDGKVAIVTGGALGIGGGASHGFAEEGARVIVADIDPDAGHQIVEEIKAAGGEATFVQADFSVSADPRRVVDQAIAIYGGVDFVFNNVGIQPKTSYANAEDTTEDIWDAILSINLKSYWLMSKYAIPAMRKRGGGVIVNNASVQGQQSAPLVTAYAASKGGVLSLTRQMSLDYGRENIRVLAVCPGSIDTSLMRAGMGGNSGEVPDEMDAVVAAAGTRSPIGRIGLPEDIANVVVFLCSDRASFMTGEFVNVDGGVMAQGAWADLGSAG
ncbi:MAG: glucose 1-dehydrogenase [Chloroflexi bacterium]|jgi:NAD(P)-dependent dehydrogenase (short-subunit alcohol dehydrogenase family)|nr:glucose 1-dehydrogenase [Chloroflexota bacterium]MBT4515246.1 glucose 1-dehydrogenase [Chloroflexota bacterium]MBT5320243.1 glucose 1-dehydrogenase [Chloroflexota bacterium]